MNCKISWNLAASIKIQSVIERPQECSDCLTTDFRHAFTALLRIHPGCISWGGFISTSGLVLLLPSHRSLVHASPLLHLSITTAANGNIDVLWEDHEMSKAWSLFGVGNANADETTQFPEVLIDFIQPSNFCGLLQGLSIQDLPSFHIKLQTRRPTGTMSQQNF